MHYVIGDVHGCYNQLMNLLKIIEEMDNAALYYFVGDFIDRGTDSFKVLNWAMSNITIDGKYQSVRGNHEQSALEWINKEYELWYVITKNEDPTSLLDETCPISHFNFSEMLMQNKIYTYCEIQKINKFLNSLPYVIDLKINNINYKIVHAWYDYNLPRNDVKQHAINLWERNFGNFIDSKDVLIHGHFSTVSEDWVKNNPSQEYGVIDIKNNIINVDVGACYKKYYPNYKCNLGAYCIESRRCIYSEEK